jgi:hypothetical protein
MVGSGCRPGRRPECAGGRPHDPRIGPGEAGAGDDHREAAAYRRQLQEFPHAAAMRGLTDRSGVTRILPSRAPPTRVDRERGRFTPLAGKSPGTGDRDPGVLSEQQPLYEPAREQGQDARTQDDQRHTEGERGGRDLAGQAQGPTGGQVAQPHRENHTSMAWLMTRPGASITARCAGCIGSIFANRVATRNPLPHDPRDQRSVVHDVEGREPLSEAGQVLVRDRAAAGADAPGHGADWT